MDFKIWVLLVAAGTLLDIISKWRKKQRQMEAQREQERALDRQYQDQSQAQDQYAYQAPEPVTSSDPRVVTLPFPIDVYTSDDEEEDDWEPVADTSIEGQSFKEQSFDIPTPKSIGLHRATLRESAPAFMQTTRRKRQFVLNPVTARQAVVWMEILGPPKGMQ